MSKPSRLRRRTTAAIWVVVVAVAVAGVTGMTAGLHSETEKVAAAAHRIVVPDNWVQEHIEVKPASVACLGGDPCPSAAMVWQVPEGVAVTMDDFQAILAASGITATPTGTCGRKFAGSHGNHTVCSAEEVRDGLKTRVAIRDDDTLGETKFVASVRPAH